ncbi:substrate-binding domain-containing protein [Actinomadura rayongensis]|uniref:Solute-binding protein n=1 Tax=Actinomadura rayongensis TaxID=1429076 RepID=A0A6I4WG55_9ACTN|nr:solute-binding protein [Actinomadura rayongensis]
MSGRHRNDFPDEGAEGGEHDPSRPVFGPANDGSSDWFAPRDSQSPRVTPGESGEWSALGGTSDSGSRGTTPPPPSSGPYGTYGYGSGAYERPSTASGGFEQPPSGTGGYERPTSATGGFQLPPGGTGGFERPTGGTGGFELPPSGTGGFERPAGGTGGYGRSSGGYERPSTGSGGFELPSSGTGGYERPSSGSGEIGGYTLPGASSAGYRGYDTMSGSGERQGGFFGGRSGGDSGGPGGPGGSGEYGRPRRKRRGVLIGPLAGAIGLAVLLGVGVYAFLGTGGCGGDGALRLRVSAAPDIAPAVRKAVDRFNDQGRKVDGKCVQASVGAEDPSSVATVLSGQGVPSDTARQPDVWIPDSTLWTSLVQTSTDKARHKITVSRTSVASSPIVVGLPQTLAGQLQKEGVTATPSWDNLLKAAGGVAGGGVTKNQMIPAGAVRMVVPDPTVNAVGLGGLVLTGELLTNDPNRDSIFTGIVRTVREATVAKPADTFRQFRPGRSGRQPISISSEQALWSYNRTSPAEPAVALYPVEGTLSLDYPFTVTTGDDAKKRAAGLLEQAMNTDATRTDVRELGFRSPDGKAPTAFSQKYGVTPARPRQLPAPKPADVAQTMQAWSKLSLGIRLLTLTDVSGSMAEPVGGGMNRLQALARVEQGGLSMLPNDTELGVWSFSTHLVGNRDYRELVPIGGLGDRIGSTTRRNMVLTQLNQIRPKPNGDTALYASILAAYKEMNRTYKPEFVNTILLFTDGQNDDPDGPTLQEAVAQLKAMRDPNKPIQVNMIGYGKDVDEASLREIGRITNGTVQLANTPQDIQKIVLKLLARRINE